MLVVTAESSLSKTDSQSLLLKKIKALESVLKFKLQQKSNQRFEFSSILKL